MKPSPSTVLLLAALSVLLAALLAPLQCRAAAQAVKQQQQPQPQPAESGSAAEPSGMESKVANAKVQFNQLGDMATAAGSNHGKSHGKYFMYTEVPKKGSYKMGFKRGNKKHEIERKESVKKSHVHSYFKWHDKKGKGSHKFEFKHEEKKKKHY